MRWFFKASAFLLINLLFLSCVEDQRKELSQHLEIGVERSGFSELLKKDILVVIPRIGCMGCISLAETFMLESYEEYADKLNFLLIDIGSYKTIRVRFEVEFLEAPNVFVDWEQVFNNNQFSGLYPMILYLDKGKVAEVSLISPDNAHAMASLKLILSE